MATEWGYSLAGTCEDRDTEAALAEAITSVLRNARFGVTSTNRGVQTDGEITHVGPFATGGPR